MSDMARAIVRNGVCIDLQRQLLTRVLVTAFPSTRNMVQVALSLDFYLDNKGTQPLPSGQSSPSTSASSRRHSPTPGPWNSPWNSPNLAAKFCEHHGPCNQTASECMDPGLKRGAERANGGLHKRQHNGES